MTTSLQQQLQVALAQHRAGILQEAEAGYRAILQTEPNHPHALHLLGVLAFQTQHLAESQTLISQALQLQPQLVDAWNNLGLVQQAQQNHSAALQSFTQALQLQPQNIDAYFNRGNVWRLLGNGKKAIADYNTVLALAPQHAGAWNNRGLARQLLGRFEAALADHQQAIELAPTHAEFYSNRGLAEHELGRYTRALNSYESALRYDPHLNIARLNRGLTQLLLGEFHRAWPDYALRPVVAPIGIERQRLAHDLTGDLVLKLNNLQNKHAFVYAEQGLGDTLQFCRYVLLLAKHCAKLTVAVQPSLKKLLQCLTDKNHTIVVIGLDEPLPSTDWQTSMLDLPHWFDTNPETIPYPQPYLTAEKTQIQRWDKQLQEAWINTVQHNQLTPPLNSSGDSRPIRIGFCWTGNPENTRNSKRSIPLTFLLESLPKTVENRPIQWLCLQRDYSATEQILLKNNPLIVLVQDHWEGMAGLLCNLDAIISVDTALAHLAGALGRRVYILLAQVPDWRWLLERTDCPWYASAHLIRQTRRDDWVGVVNQLWSKLCMTEFT